MRMQHAVPHGFSFNKLPTKDVTCKQHLGLGAAEQLLTLWFTSDMSSPGSAAHPVAAGGPRSDGRGQQLN